MACGPTCAGPGSFESSSAPASTTKWDAPGWCDTTVASTVTPTSACEPADVGVTVLATVVSHQPGASHFVVDAGALELSKDPGPAHVGPQAMGTVRGAPELTVATLSQEHGLIRAESAAVLEGRFRVGDRLELVPNHSCLSVAHFDTYHVVEG